MLSDLSANTNAGRAGERSTAGVDAAPRDPAAESSRKVLHLASALIPLVYQFVDRPLMLGLLGACVAIAVAVEILRQRHAGFRAFFRQTVGVMVRRDEWTRVCGATYVLAGCWLTVALFPKPVATVAMLVLAVSDTAASTAGLRYGRTRFLGKSLAGSLAFFLTAFLVVWLGLPAAKALAFVVALVATLTEALPSPRLGIFELSDNLTIPLATAVAIVVLQ